MENAFNKSLAIKHVLNPSIYLTAIQSTIAEFKKRVNIIALTTKQAISVCSVD